MISSVGKMTSITLGDKALAGIENDGTAITIVVPYEGTYVNAELASTKIDLSTITTNCNEVDEIANSISNINNKMYDAGSSITSEALSFDGENVISLFDECCTMITNYQNQILNKTEQIRDEALAIYNKFQTEFNDDAKEKDGAKKKEALANCNE